ncbi:MAG: DUF7149 domain-containing protein, partial [Candidatus Kapaibacteriota bacterium]
MNLETRTPKQLINKIFFNTPISKKEFNEFSTEFQKFLHKINVKETEEHNKNILRDFLKNTFYKDFVVNTSGYIDLAIFNGSESTSSIAVIFEVKSPQNYLDLPQSNDPNRKAFHELLLYYLQEKIGNGNHSLKHLVATNCLKWYIFDASDFERLFARNTTLVQQFHDWKAKKFDDASTDFFYNKIAKPFIANLDASLECVFVDFEPYFDKPISQDSLFELFKLFAPPNLLKLPFANDNNSLNREFYDELLHILGLEEVNQGNILIKRLPPASRHSGSLIENTIEMLRNSPRFDKAHDEDATFEVALELVLTWLNRILFLKLLEGMLVSHKPNLPAVRFLNSEKIRDFNTLNELFFDVLAVPPQNRKPQVDKFFKEIPFLNSSLFELTEYEKNYLSISELKNRYTIPYFNKTVLLDNNGKRKSGEVQTLEYLLNFLNAFNFGSVESPQNSRIQEQPKTIINAAVLGLIFEKINGYRDGSYFTPGSITMFMARTSIRKALTDLFNRNFNWKANEFDDLRNYIVQDLNRTSILRYNQVFDSIRICDPAVGSGHFLVSCLNELIACKSILGILADENGNILPVKALVENDELIFYDNEGNLFSYYPNDSDSARIQRSIFNEKRTLIENCLFGVDINPKSVYITRLRLWIELLKNAYYNDDGNLETLPNIDLNIKVGDSLLSRFALDDSSISQYNSPLISQYKQKVKEYKRQTDRNKRKKIHDQIENLKSQLRTNIIQRSSLVTKKFDLQRQIYSIDAQLNSFIDNDQNERLRSHMQKLKKDLEEIEKQIECERLETQNFKFFEWRFEFPEVLDDDGNFSGFDIVIGNPPYIQLQKEGGKLAKLY